VTANKVIAKLEQIPIYKKNF